MGQDDTLKSRLDVALGLEAFAEEVEDDSTDLVVDDPVLEPSSSSSEESEDSDELKRERKKLSKVLMKTINAGQKALEEAVRLGENDDSPRAYEVAAQLIKSIGENAERCLNLYEKVETIQKKRKEINTTVNNENNNTTNNNILFAGTADDLLTLLQDHAKPIKRVENLKNAGNEG